MVVASACIYSGGRLIGSLRFSGGFSVRLRVGDSDQISDWMLAEVSGGARRMEETLKG